MPSPIIWNSRACWIRTLWNSKDGVTNEDNCFLMNSADTVDHKPVGAEPIRLPDHPLADWRISVPILIGLWLAIYMVGLSRAPLLDDADTVHAEAAREMLQRHDWVTLYVNGERYLEKAPLMYWSVALSYKLFGVGEWQTRLPLALAVLALAWSAFIFGRRYLGEEAGVYAAVIMINAPGV